MKKQWMDKVARGMLGMVVAGWGVCAAQEVGPEITVWLQNTTATGSYYVTGNPTTLPNGILVNCQAVAYSDDWVYVTASGVPAYPTGPFQDGNPSQATHQNRINRFPRVPQPAVGVPTSTTPGNIGLFINGVALFDYRDGVAWNPNTQSLCGGPGNPPCPGGPMATMAWNRDAVVAERHGFDCAKGHPAMGNYHHHQNPSAFDLDYVVISDICNLYDADGLYVMDAGSHSPLIGFAYDGYPIYGAYGFQGADGTGGIVRIESGYALRNITVRTHHADGSDVPDGPPVSAQYPLGYFREDYEFLPSPGQPQRLDAFNGRFCVTPEYPQGTYAYFTTVDANQNSAYPYAVGPQFYGEVTGGAVNAIAEATTLYTGANAISEAAWSRLAPAIFPNPTSDFCAVQTAHILTHPLTLRLLDATGTARLQQRMIPGSTLSPIDVQTLPSGTYFLEIDGGGMRQVLRLVVAR